MKRNVVITVIMMLCLVSTLFTTVGTSTAASKGSLTDYLVGLDEPQTYKNDDGTDLQITVQKVKKPVFIVGEAKGNLYGGRKFAEGMIFYTDDCKPLKVGTSSEASSIGTKLTSLGASTITGTEITIDTYVYYIENKEEFTIPFEKYHIYDENGKYLGVYNYKEFTNSIYDEEETYTGHQIGDSKEVKIKNVTYDKSGLMATVTIEWNFTGDEILENITYGMLNKKGEYIESQNNDWDMPSLYELGSDEYNKFIQKGTADLLFTASGKAEIIVNSTEQTYILNRDIDLKTANDEIGPDKPDDKGDKEEKGVLKVSFDPLPKKALKGTAINVGMHTTINAIKVFGGNIDSVYSKKSNFTIKENGTYEYMAESKDGQKVKGSITVSCFVDDTNDLGLDDYFSDPNAPNDMLPQTGGLHWAWRLLIGIAFVGVGVSLYILFRRKKINK